MAHPPVLPSGDCGSVPNVPIVQSVSMSSMAIGQSGGTPAGQTFLQPSTMVPQVSPSVPQQYFQVKRVMTLACYNIKAIFIFYPKHLTLLLMVLKLWFYYFVTFWLISLQITIYPSMNNFHNPLKLSI